MSEYIDQIISTIAPLVREVVTHPESNKESAETLLASIRNAMECVEGHGRLEEAKAFDKKLNDLTKAATAMDSDDMLSEKDFDEQEETDTVTEITMDEAQELADYLRKVNELRSTEAGNRRFGNG